MRILNVIGTVIVTLSLVLALVALVLAAATPVQAQQGQCAPRDTVAAHLAQKYGETRRGMGIAANSMVMEVWASADTGSWTITVTTPAGATCLVASGQNFEPVNDLAPIPGVPG